MRSRAQVVLDRLVQIRALFNTSMALHWYEWQQGPDPSPAARYRFDTHYPDYFPPRSDFFDAVNALQAINVSVFPYINGRIFDSASQSYVRDNGAQYCTKKAAERFGAKQLSLYVETYGSGASFNVADPTTDYWQQKIAGGLAM